MIYFIRESDNGPIKVGVTKRPETRLKSLQTGNPRPLKLISILPGYAAKEKKIKSDLKVHSINGEWFNPAPHVLEYIADIQYSKYELHDGSSFAVLSRDMERSKTDPCPFCSKTHIHGFGDGHRGADCSGYTQDAKAKDGTVLNKEKGYIVRTRKRKFADGKNYYAVFNNSKVYHIAVLAKNENKFDRTLCDLLLTSRKGINVWPKYGGGSSVPIVVDNPPNDLSLCKHCKKLFDE